MEDFYYSPSIFISFFFIFLLFLTYIITDKKIQRFYILGFASRRALKFQKSALPCLFKKPQLAKIRTLLLKIYPKTALP